MWIRGAEILEKRGIQRPVSYFKNTQVSNLLLFVVKNFLPFCIISHPVTFSLLISHVLWDLVCEYSVGFLAWHYMGKPNKLLILFGLMFVNKFFEWFLSTHSASHFCHMYHYCSFYHILQFAASDIPVHSLTIFILSLNCSYFVI